MSQEINVYKVTLSDGTIYDVTTTLHHDDHPEPTFKRHLLDIIKSSISGIISNVVVGFVHKGRK